MRILYAVVLSIIMFSTLSAASQMTHAYLANQWLEAHGGYDKTYKRNFLLGTLFPDIRYLAKVPRTTTHRYGISLKKISRYNNSFLAGKQFHSFVDEIREKLIKKSGILKKLKAYNIPGKKHVAVLKILEDEILFPELNRKEVKECLYHINPTEYHFGIESRIIQQWHELLHRYFTFIPHQSCIMSSIVRKYFFGFSPQELKELSTLLKKLSHDEVFIKHIQHMKKRFDKKFKEALS